MSENNPTGEPQGNPPVDPAGSNPNNGVEPQGSSTPNNNPTSDPAEQARRKAQSAKDKAVSENDNLRERLDAVEPFVARIAQKEAVNQFLTEHGSEYPHVKAEDLEFLGVSNDDEAKMASEYLEKRFKTSEQDALVRVQDTNDLGMTDEERRKAIEDLDKSDTPGQSKFLKYLGIKAQPTKK